MQRKLTIIINTMNISSHCVIFTLSYFSSHHKNCIIIKHGIAMSLCTNAQHVKSIAGLEGQYRCLELLNVTLTWENCQNKLELAPSTHQHKKIQFQPNVECVGFTIL